MNVEIKIPSPGESISEVELTNWFVADGAYVEKNQDLAELESDKATLTLTAEASGKIKLLAAAGNAIAVGAIACTIDTSAAPEQNQVQDTVPKEMSQPETKKVPEQITKVLVDEQKVEGVKISPLAKKILEENQISQTQFVEKLHRISRQDVISVLSSKEEAPTKKTTERKQERQKMSALRKKLSQRLVQVKNQTAMLTTFNEVDMSALMNLREKYKKDFQDKYGVKLGFMSFFARAASIALQYHPNLNSMIDGEEIVQHNYTDIGIAVQTPKGLMVPVVRNVNAMNLSETEIEIANLAQKARDGKISLDELSGGTFTITNGGVFGSLLSTPIINPPQSGILGMHSIKERPIAENGQVVIRPMMYIALSYDHRIVDGKDSVGFLVKIKELIEQPERLLFDGKSPLDKLILG